MSQAKHLEHAYRKLGMTSRAAAVSRMAMAGVQDSHTKKGLTRQGAPDLQSGSARVRRY